MKKLIFKKRVLPKILLVFVMVLILVMASTVFSVQMRLFLNSIYLQVWNWQEPQSYVIKFSEYRPIGSVYWVVYVEDGEPLWTQMSMDLTREIGYPGQFSKETITVEELFAFVGDECIDEGFLRCAIVYDFEYRYPKKAESYPVFIFEVTDFISCDKTPDDCASMVPILEP